MSKLLNNILGITFISAGVVVMGSYPKSAQLFCQKVNTSTANCRTEVKTLAGWGTNGIDEYPEIRQAQVAQLSERVAGGRTKEGSKITYWGSQFVKRYPILLIDRTGQKVRLAKVTSHDAQTSQEIADRFNQFIRSTESEIFINVNDDRSSSNERPEGDLAKAKSEKVYRHLFFGSILLSCGILLVFLTRIWPGSRETPDQTSS